MASALRRSEAAEADLEKCQHLLSTSSSLFMAQQLPQNQILGHSTLSTVALVPEPTLTQTGQLRPALSGPAGFKGCSTSGVTLRLGMTGTMHTVLAHSSKPPGYFLPVPWDIYPPCHLFLSCFPKGMPLSYFPATAIALTRQDIHPQTPASDNTLKCAHHLPAQVRLEQAATLSLKRGWSRASLCPLLGMSNNSTPQPSSCQLLPLQLAGLAAQYRTPKPFHRVLAWC